jgi:hypothetical protein
MSFDFWLGTWRGTWETEDGPAEATNRITKEYGGHVISERFSTDGFTGMSVSVFDEHARIWRQTWVDDTGAYLDFAGGWANESMTLVRDARDESGSFRQRMVWHKIESERFEWLWQRSSDGDEWLTRWKIDYERIAAS